MSGSSSSNISLPKDMTPEEFKKQRGFVAGSLQAGSLGRGVGAGSEGPFAAQIGSQEQSQLNNLLGVAGTNDPSSQAAQSALMRQLAPGQAGTEEQAARLRALTAPAIRQAGLELEGARGGFTQAGHKLQSSSPFARAAGDVQGRLNESIVSAGAQLAMEGDQRQLQAVAQQAQTATQRLNNAREALTASALPRLVEQLGIEGGQKEFARRMEAMQQALLGLGQLTAPTLGQFSFGETSSGGVSL